MSPAPVVGILFSKDRAMQLDACLRSFRASCQDPERASLSVLYRATTPRHASQYATLSRELNAQGSVQLIQETNFRRDLLRILLSRSPLQHLHIVPSKAASLLLPALSRAVGSRRSLRRPAYVLFLVDDTLFTRSFSLDSIILSLEATPQAIGFSLRLGGNTDFCYPHGRPQRLPAFTPLATGIQAFDWTRAELDFNYPLEVSSSVYSLEHIIPLLVSTRFSNPNNLESRVASRAAGLVRRWPWLLSFQTSVAFNNPVNIVQAQEPNRAAQQVAYSTEELADRFDSGWRIDVEKFRSFTPHACHQEVGFDFVPSSGAR